MKTLSQHITESLVITEAANSNLELFSNTVLSDERKGYYHIFTNLTIKSGVLTGTINDNKHGSYTKADVEADLKNDEKIVTKKLQLLNDAIAEFNKQNNSALKITSSKIIKGSITTSKHQGYTVYDAIATHAKIEIK